jgi:hypothetical protein
LRLTASSVSPGEERGAEKQDEQQGARDVLERPDTVSRDDGLHESDDGGKKQDCRASGQQAHR